MKQRKPVVAGQFYPANPEQLKKTLEKLFSFKKTKAKAKEAILPHAGYKYSGKTTAKTIAMLKKADTFIILSPNHTGLGSRIALSESEWETSLGKMLTDKETVKSIEKKTKAEIDELAHAGEHSIEVILPFLQQMFGKTRIVPITISETDFYSITDFGEKLAEINSKKNICVIASSDFSHFIPEKHAIEKDKKAIEFIKKLDCEGFYKEVIEKQLSICGLAPIIATMAYCKKKKRKKGKLIEYITSAKETKDKSNVVGYAGIIFT